MGNVCKWLWQNGEGQDRGHPGIPPKWARGGGAHRALLADGWMQEKRLPGRLCSELPGTPTSVSCSHIQEPSWMKTREILGFTWLAASPSTLPTHANCRLESKAPKKWAQRHQDLPWHEIWIKNHPHVTTKASVSPPGVSGVLLSCHSGTSFPGMADPWCNFWAEGNALVPQCFIPLNSEMSVALVTDFKGNLSRFCASKELTQRNLDKT